jgi:hairy-and-enhancer-of-split protein
MAPVVKNEFKCEDFSSRTDQYRKVMKPLLERKRRARINACLDELKDLMVFALQTEGENISKLEKADVLELTVRHLQKLKRQQMLALNPALDLDRFHAGYTACATEVSKCLASTGVDITVGSRLMSHLGHKLHTIESSRVSPLRVRVPSSSSDCGYFSGRDSTPSPSSSTCSGLLQISPAEKTSTHLSQHSPVWRPF